MNIILLYRVERWLFEQHIPVLPKIVQLLIFLIFNSKITADSKIGKGTYCVCKGISTVLIPGTEIGENCVLGLRFSTVRQFPYKEVPHLKNNVWVGPNVIIAGPVVIEDDVIIAGNSFVNRSVPQGAIVAGCPAKIAPWGTLLLTNEFPKVLSLQDVRQRLLAGEKILIMQLKQIQSIKKVICHF